MNHIRSIKQFIIYAKFNGNKRANEKKIEYKKKIYYERTNTASKPKEKKRTIRKTLSFDHREITLTELDGVSCCWLFTFSHGSFIGVPTKHMKPIWSVTQMFHKVYWRKKRIV